MSSKKNRKGNRGSLKVQRLPVTFSSDIRRVITRFFDPGGEARIRSVVERVGGLSDEQVDRLLDEVFSKFRNRHDNIAAVLEENYRTAMTMIGLSDDFSRQSPPADRILLDRRVFDRVGGAVQSLDRPASEPTEPARGRGAVHHEPAGDRRGARLVDRFPHRRHLLRSPDPNRSPAAAIPGPIRVVPDKEYEKSLFRRKLKDIGVNEGVVDLVLDRLGDVFTSAQLEHAVTEVAGGRPRNFKSRNRSRISAGWPTRITNWSFRAKRRRRRS